MTLNELNQLDDNAAYDWFEASCAAERWVNAMVTGRTYKSAADVYSYAVEVWESLTESDYSQAFEAHPMIGDVNSLRAKFANTKDTAASEQQGTAVASEETLQALHTLNHEYLNKHGFIFIICATGLSANTMLEALQKRLPNDTVSELENAAAEQIKITLLRLTKGLSAPTQEASS